MPADVPSSPGGGEPREPLRVLLVDDSPDLLALLRTLFADRPHLEVAGQAGDGEAAVAMAASIQPELIVLDIAMPVLDGVAALPRLLEASPESRVVMLSALPRETSAPAALAAGAAAYVQKSVDTESLVDEILGGAGLLETALRSLSAIARESYAADPRSVGASRRFMTSTLEQWGERELADTITLLLSELVTNAVVHAQAAPDVTVRLLPDRVHVEVTDTAPDTDPDAVRAKELDETSTGGRGLAMVEALSMGWGSVPLPGGKVVWFDVARTQATD